MLKDVNIKFKYDSDQDDLVNDFYIPVLSHSEEYLRMSGFFSSSSLAISAQGIADLIRNNGKMKLLCSSILPEDDIEIIEEFHKHPEKFIETSFFNDIDNLEDIFIKNHVEALGWMLANDLLEIKIAIPIDKKGIFHSKIGILRDEEANLISFSGSDNETASGWVNNIEEFKVFRSWDESEKKFVESDYDDFYKYWNGNTLKTDIIDLPIAIKKKLIQLAPPSKDDLAILDKNEIIPGIKLRKYQNNAIDSWFDNDCCGIFEMATGTGKTFTALSCFKKLLDSKDKLFTVIACPQSHLVDQWAKDLKKFYDGEILIVPGKYPNWQAKLMKAMKNLLLGITDKLVVMTTHKSLSSDKFISVIKKFSLDSLLIVDEVHGIGSEKQQLALIENYNYRLGLSATPKRWFDDEGTQLLYDYFGDIVFSFDIERALREINPDTGKTYLTPYIYKPIVVDLNDDEYEQYYEYTLKIAQSFGSNKKEDLDRVSLYSNLRQKIVNNAEAKYDALNTILADFKSKNEKEMDKLIVFCSEKQIDKVQEILIENKILPQTRFTSHQSAGKKKGEKYSEREIILKNFSDGVYKALVAIKCLDEGVDVPSAENAIIMSSTSNPREHVQRRGRILRNSPGKEMAVIYDILVFPEEKTEAGKKILMKEIERYKEFAENASNSYECKKLLRKYYYKVV